MIFIKLVCNRYNNVQVNEDTRKKMFALRQTWNDVFAPPKLYTLDVKVNAIDQNWPIQMSQKPAATPQQPVPKTPAIHVNPNFFSNTVRCCYELTLNRLQVICIYDFFFMFLSRKRISIRS